jgi:transposase
MGIRSDETAFPSDGRQKVEDLLRQSPPQIGFLVPPARWSLDALRRSVDFFHDYSLSGIWRRLRSWHLAYKRGRSYLHSPDPLYQEKIRFIEEILSRARQQPLKVVALYLDELTYYRQPSVDRDWIERGAACQRLAQLSYRSNSKQRVVGALNALTGETLHRQSTRIGRKELAAFYRQIRSRYPDAEIYVIQDNWPIHFLPDVLAAATECRIELVRLPTYAPWLNPVEKLWRLVKQTILHLHRLSDDWNELKARVTRFLDEFTKGSDDLLRYVGLLTD